MKRWRSTSILRPGTLAALVATVFAALVVGGCTRHTIDVQPIRVEPIHLTVDINLKVDHELDKFFDFEDKAQAPATQPVEAAPLTQSSPTPTSPSSGGLP